MESYSDIAYSGIFSPKKSDWKSILIDAPPALAITENVRKIFLSQTIIPISITRVDSKHLVIATYLNVFILNEETEVLFE